MWSSNNFCQLEGLQTYYRQRALYGCPTLEINKHLTELNQQLTQKAESYKKLDKTNSEPNDKTNSEPNDQENNTEKKKPKKKLKDELPQNNTYLGLDSKFYNWQQQKSTNDNTSYAQVTWKESSRLGSGGSMMGDVSIVFTHHYQQPNNKNTPEAQSSNTQFLEQIRSKMRQQQEERERRMQEQRLDYLRRKQEYYKRQKELEMQLRILEEQRQLREEQEYEEQKFEEEVERCKHQLRFRTTICDVLTELLGANTGMSYLSMALMFFATWGAYSFVR